MRMKCLATILIALAAFGLAASQPAAADDGPGDAVRRAPAKHVQHVAHRRGLWPGGPDPYAYSYERSSYYPYYNSAYWVPRAEMRYRTRYPMRIPEYASSWGYPLSCKLQGRRNCGVPYERRAGHDLMPRHAEHAAPHAVHRSSTPDAAAFKPLTPPATGE